jgi:glutamyl-tRNA synthetase
VGGARTALFNYLLAKNTGGTFILRIEDTDRSRYQEDALEEIFTSLRWLGMEWDEGPQAGGAYGPYFQSERKNIYHQHARYLIESGSAYYCFCSSQRLEELRNTGASGYDRCCRNIPAEKAQHQVESGEPHVIRLKIPDNREINFYDTLRGNITFNTAGLDDFVLMKTDGFPTYHMANVVDDHLMKISHVLRGDEWINSTPKHELLYEAFGWEPPAWVHLPIILSEDGGKLSKRKGAASVMDYAERGILPDALFNFLSLLGWSPGDDTELMDRSELISRFRLESVSSRAAVFDTKKLEWMNGHYLAECPVEDLLSPVKKILTSRDISVDESLLAPALELMKSRSRTIPDLADSVEFFFSDPVSYPDDNKKVRKAFRKEDCPQILRDVKERLFVLENFDPSSVEEVLQTYMKETELGFGRVGLPVRIAVTGAAGGPSLFEIMSHVGRDAVIRRLDSCLHYIDNNYSGVEK